MNHNHYHLRYLYKKKKTETKLKQTHPSIRINLKLKQTNADRQASESSKRSKQMKKSSLTPIVVYLQYNSTTSRVPHVFKAISCQSLHPSLSHRLPEIGSPRLAPSTDSFIIQREPNYYSLPSSSSASASRISPLSSQHAMERIYTRFCRCISVRRTFADV